MRFLGFTTQPREGESPREPKHPLESGLAGTLALPEGRISARGVSVPVGATRAVAENTTTRESK
jgi:hypothetical protein